MSNHTYESFFTEATGFKPFPYQTEFATGKISRSLLSVPTGLGKTAAVILAWLWRRRFGPEVEREAMPRRLVYCLPMRVLVEQTHECASRWLRRLGLLAEQAPDTHPVDSVAVHMLMGGDLERDWDRWPDRDQIIIGTQDMLLSRALNRGYSMSRYRWPVQFGLLNNDALWVMDEVQLMGSGLATTAQLQAFRRQLGSVSPCRSIWMSATMRPEWLDTVDFSADEDAQGRLALSDADRVHPEVKKRLTATKRVRKAPFTATKNAKDEAALIIEKHKAGSRTLVVVNTVKRAAAIYDALAKSKKNDAEIVLLHSHFRPRDRKAALERALAPPGEAGSITVSTQVVEAGVDVSAKLMFTDLAPWPSLVQRFGRCNRSGEIDEATIIWFDIELDAKGNAAAPYTNEGLEQARQKLVGLTDAAPESLPEVDSSIVPAHVIRRRDIVELFDTTPDLAGADIDVSKFIREADEHNVQVFWRDFNDDPMAGEPAPHRDELCPAPLGEIRSFLGEHSAWRWDHLERAWGEARSAFPGLVLMLRADDGGYSEERGWITTKSGRVSVVRVDPDPCPGYDDDRETERALQTLADHSDAVVEELERLLVAARGVTDPCKESLRLAARWHDAGKAHDVFKAAVVTDTEADEHQVWGKAPRIDRYSRPGFRHELASALAMSSLGLPDLAVYLAAAHHGKVRLSIRSLPHERPPEDYRARFARGIWDGDTLAPCDLGGGVLLPETHLDLICMELGRGPNGPSWLARMLRLRDDPNLGPFRLAFLEALLRVADWRASSKEVAHA